MYSPTTFSGASPRAQALSHELLALVAQRRSHDPSLGVPDALVALELAKASLVGGSGAAASQALIIAVALATLVAGFAVFFVAS